MSAEVDLGPRLARMVVGWSSAMCKGRHNSASPLGGHDNLPKVFSLLTASPWRLHICSIAFQRLHIAFSSAGLSKQTFGLFLACSCYYMFLLPCQVILLGAIFQGLEFFQGGLCMATSSVYHISLCLLLTVPQVGAA